MNKRDSEREMATAVAEIARSVGRDNVSYRRNYKVLKAMVDAVNKGLEYCPTLLKDTVYNTVAKSFGTTASTVRTIYKSYGYFQKGEPPVGVALRYVNGYKQWETAHAKHFAALHRKGSSHATAN